MKSKNRYTFELVRGKNVEGINYFWWRMRGTNHRILCTSETYTAKANALKSVESIITHLTDGGAECAYVFINKT